MQPGSLSRTAFQYKFFQDQKDAIVNAPQHIVPVGAVPDTSEHPDDENIPDLLHQTFPVSSQWDVNVFPKPGAQGDMPSSPEFRDAPGNIRIIEVFQEMEAKHFSETDSHIGITGEIKVDLEGVGQGSQPGSRHRKLGNREGLPPHPREGRCYSPAGPFFPHRSQSGGCLP